MNDKDMNARERRTAMRAIDPQVTGRALLLRFDALLMQLHDRPTVLARMSELTGLSMPEIIKRMDGAAYHPRGDGGQA